MDTNSLNLQKSNLETKKDSGLYHLSIKLNAKTHDIFTDDLKSAILSVKPKFALKTKIIFNIEKAGKVCNKVVMANTARNLFKNDAFLNLFIKQLSFKDNG